MIKSSGDDAHVRRCLEQAKTTMIFMPQRFVAWHQRDRARVLTASENGDSLHAFNAISNDYTKVLMKYESFSSVSAISTR